jgi:hypothetical protein
MKTSRLLTTLSLLLLGACPDMAAWAGHTDDARQCREEGGEWLVGQGPEAASCSFAKRIAACDAEHGKWQRIGKAGFPACVHQSRDAGKACSDASECQFGCDAGMQKPASSGPVTGKCAANDDHFGCHAWVEHGRIKESVCAD